MRSRRLSPALALCLGLLALPAAAADFEIYAGYYTPNDDFFQEGLSYGVRGTWLVRDDWTAGVSVGRWEDSQSETFGGIQFPGLPPIGGVTVDLDLALTLVDLSIGRRLRSTGWTVYGGPGWAFAEADAKATAFGLPIDFEVSDTERDDSFSLHFGIAGKFPVGERLYVRPDLPARWFSEGSSGTDLEASVALGWSL